jgi:hypothetical protein
MNDRERVEPYGLLQEFGVIQLPFTPFNNQPFDILQRNFYEHEQQNPVGKRNLIHTIEYSARSLKIMYDGNSEDDVTSDGECHGDCPAKNADCHPKNPMRPHRRHLLRLQCRLPPANFFGRVHGSLPPSQHKPAENNLMIGSRKVERLVRSAWAGAYLPCDFVVSVIAASPSSAQC